MHLVAAAGSGRAARAPDRGRHYGAAASAPGERASSAVARALPAPPALLPVVALAALLVAGCAGLGTASPTPAYEISDVVAQLVVRGVTVEHETSGDAGCPGSRLHSNGVHFQLALPGAAGTSDVYLLRWKDSDAFGAAAADFDACVSEYRAAHANAGIDQVVLDPWRAYGPSWGSDLHATLQAALEAASGG
jgi:hypothetical protein